MNPTTGGEYTPTPSPLGSCRLYSRPIFWLTWLGGPQNNYRSGRLYLLLGVDLSYVSRVARGECQSREIEALLSREISRILASLTKGKAKVRKGRTER